MKKMQLMSMTMTLKTFWFTRTSWIWSWSIVSLVQSYLDLTWKSEFQSSGQTYWVRRLRVRMSYRAQRFWHLHPLLDTFCSFQILRFQTWNGQQHPEHVWSASPLLFQTTSVRNAVGNSRWGRQDKGVCYVYKLHDVQLVLRTLTVIGTCPFLNPLLLKISENEWKELILLQSDGPLWAT